MNMPNVYGIQVEVDSSTIDKIFYDNQSVLFIDFLSGGRYKYDEVTPEEFFALITAESIGKQFHRTIRDVKDTTKVR